MVWVIVKPFPLLGQIDCPDWTIGSYTIDGLQNPEWYSYGSQNNKLGPG